MRQHLCRVIGNTRLWGEVQRIALDAPELAETIHPAQFALVRDPRSFDPYLRRKAWFYDAERGAIHLTLPSADPIAITSRDGDLLDLLAPLGRAVDWPESAHHLWFVGEGSHIAPLLGMAPRAVRRGNSVVFSFIAANNQVVLPAHLLPPEVEYQAGPAVNPDLFAWADAMVASGPSSLYQVLSNGIREVRMRLERGFMTVLVDLPMPCGTGACFSCAVETSRGIKLACTDGPLFDWVDLNRREW
jgi:dihydroorotate dehydrogenase electron transfer subunit